MWGVVPVISTGVAKLIWSQPAVAGAVAIDEVAEARVAPPTMPQ